MNLKYVLLVIFALMLTNPKWGHDLSMNSTAKQIARRRVQTLFEEANHTYKDNPVLAKSYVLNARKIAMAARMRLPQSYKRSICQKCNIFLVLGESSRVRIKQSREPHITITCLKCGNQSRFPLRSNKKEKIIN
jgi:ribonuclease P protein subunit RPR2